MMKLIKNFKGLLSDEKGIALVTVLVVSTVLAAVGNSYLSSTTPDIKHATNSVAQQQAFFVAETGVEYARYRLQMQDQWITTGWTAAITTPAMDGDTGIASVTFNNYNDAYKTATITVVGHFRKMRRRIIMDVQAVLTAIPPFAKAICGCTGVNFAKDSVTIDSYSSTTGSYASQTPGENGDVGSNGNLNLAGATIHGSARAGGNIDSLASAHLYGDAAMGGVSGILGTVDGTTTVGINPPPQPCSCSAFDIPDLADTAKTSNNNDLVDEIDGTTLDLSGKKNGMITLNTGTYYLTGASITGNGQITIAAGADVTIILDDIDESTPAVEFKFAGNGITNASESTTNLTIYSNSTTDISLTGTSAFSGAVYAPFAEVKLGGNNDFYGSIAAAVVSIDGNVDMHYDTALGQIGGTAYEDEVVVNNEVWAVENLEIGP